MKNRFWILTILVCFFLTACATETVLRQAKQKPAQTNPDNLVLQQAYKLDNMAILCIKQKKSLLKPEKNYSVSVPLPGNPDLLFSYTSGEQYPFYKLNNKRIHEQKCPQKGNKLSIMEIDNTMKKQDFKHDEGIYVYHVNGTLRAMGYFNSKAFQKSNPLNGASQSLHSYNIDLSQTDLYKPFNHKQFMVLLTPITATADLISGTLAVVVFGLMP